MSVSNYSRGPTISRAKTMKDLIKGKHLTPDGADWLTLRMDPFHDFNRPISGYPDSDSNDTIVSVRNYETVVTEPAGLGANWDMHVFTLPFVSATLLNATATAGQIVNSATPFNLGIVNVAKSAAGEPLFTVANPVVSANFSMTRIDTFDGVEEGLSRVIGFGIEVIDTTAVLNKQGSLVSYRMPSTSHSTTTAGHINQPGTHQCQEIFQVIPSPPSTVNEAILFRSSVQWEAKEGAYMVVGQQGVENPFVLPVNMGAVISQDSTMLGAAKQVLATDLVATTALQVPPLLTATLPSSHTKMCNVTQSGIMLTGLHTDASIKIRVRVYVERAPLRGETDLIPLATPSACYDYKALALYSQITQSLPIAVPVNFNAKGDWWKIILNTIKKIAPTLGTVLVPILGPEAATIGGAVGNLMPTFKVGGKQQNRKPNPKKK